jgi:hypothetical protein
MKHNTAMPLSRFLYISANYSIIQRQGDGERSPKNEMGI